MVDKAFLITDMIDESSVKHRLDEIKEKYKYNGGDCNCGGVTKNIKEWAFDKIK